MGLSVVLGIVEEHGGGIAVRSAPQSGTTFEVFIPVLMDAVDAMPKNTAKRAPGGSESILLVDDEPYLVDMMSQILTRLGYRVTGHTAGHAAMTEFGNNPERFDLVITDLTMPAITGMQLIERVRSIKPAVPVILCSGFSQDGDAMRAADGGRPDAMLQKPVGLYELAQAVRRVLDGSGRRARTAHYR